MDYWEGNGPCRLEVQRVSERCFRGVDKGPARKDPAEVGGVGGPELLMETSSSPTARGNAPGFFAPIPPFGRRQWRNASLTSLRFF